MLVSVIRSILIVAVCVGFAGSFWFQVLVLKKQRGTGRPLWLLDPIAQLTGMFSKECAISWGFLIVGLLALFGLDKLE
ncbi:MULTISPECIES: hypothetical protein [unclassified Bradyrhizobium]|uniref:hypothetical protein n=1 Tax=unclassified Bradyrhizobium TaxID=2631580 RepID=UPI0028E3D4B3|nr:MULTISPECIES: hypothetical protein [unclassified Bradyrhizobium]